MNKHGRHSKGEKIVNNGRNKKAIIQDILLIVFIIIFIVTGIILINWYIETSKSKEKYEQLASEYTNIDNNEDETTDDVVIDFEELKNTNSDTVAWIKIENTSINYPVMQTLDNTYYLSKNFYKEKDSSGAIFMDYRNKITDKNIVIYGHHMKNGSMFADLLDVYNGSLGTDVTIYLYTPDRTMEFKVFSSYITDSR